VQQTNVTDKKSLAKRLALAYRTLKWSDMDLHALLKKRSDPTIRNYSAFVQWSTKIQTK